MPYKCVGKVLYHQKGGKWSVKQRCGSPERCKAAMRLLYGLEHGMKRREK